MGEIELRAPAVGAKMWCLFSYVSLSRSDPAGCAFDGVHSSNDHGLWISFDAVFKLFLSEALHSSRFRR